MKSLLLRISNHRKNDNMNARHESPIASYRSKLNQVQNTLLSFNQQYHNVSSLINNFENSSKLTHRSQSKQTYEPHNQESTNDKVLRILRDLYDSEKSYLNLLECAFKIFREPLRKFSSLTSFEHRLLFDNLEPIISLSCNLTVKLEKLIYNWPCELSNSGKLIGKKFLQTYEEYLRNYPQIIKLLNEKINNDEFREFCELRQLNSNNISLKAILSSPLERVHEYEQSLQNLIQITSANNNSVSSVISSNITSTNSIASIYSTQQQQQQSSFNLKLNDLQYSNLEYWKKMKEKCETIFSLNNQMHNLGINKLTSLACVQQTFPNDNLNLFEPAFQHSNIKCSSSLPEAVTALTTTKNTNDLASEQSLSSLKFEPNRRLLSTNGTSNTSTLINNKKPNSFVSKFNVQRRKTIHDTVNIDLINNLLTTNSDSISGTTTTTTSNRLSSTSSINTKSSSLNYQNSFTSTANLDQLALASVSCTRELIKQGPVTLINQYGKQDRYVFLFNDLLVIAKQKSENYNKLKYRIYLADIWISDCFDAIFSQYKSDTSVVIGWPTSNNYIIDFKDLNQKDSWSNKLKELIAIEKRKEENSTLNIKICFNRDNLGSTEPTRYSQCYTKTLQVTINETAQEVVNRCKILFQLNDNDEHQQQLINDYQLWLKTNNNDPLIPLIGHEFPYCIKMNFLRENGKSAKTDDNSLKFILIDKKTARKNSANKEYESETDRANKMRKKMFWSRSNNTTSNLTNNDVNTHSDSNNTKHMITTNLLTTSSGSSNVANTLTKPFSKLKKSHLFGVRLEKICTSTDRKLPSQLINLFEKVAREGFNCLMIFRKSASAKLKKYYKDKLDSNHAVDYDEMNVHVGALLLKEYLRDYPDGIINYGLYNECLNSLKLTDHEKKIQTTKSLMNKLSYWNFTCLRYFICLFCYISSNANVNKMDAHNISVCVAPSLFHKLDRPSDVATSYQTIAFLKFLIENSVEIFDEDTLSLLEATKHRPVLTDEQQLLDSESKLDTLNDLNMVSSLDSLKHNVELDTDSNDGNDGNNIDSSIDDVIGTSSEIEILDAASNLPDFIKKRHNKFQSQMTSMSATHHDYASLSVDSGLSVPTATSDPESEKSIESAVLMSKLHDKHAELTSSIMNKEINLRRQKRLSSNTRSLSLRDEIDLTVINNGINNNINTVIVESANETPVKTIDKGLPLNATAPAQISSTQVQPKLYTKSDINKRTNLITANKYQKRVSTIMKQFSESDICVDAQTPITPPPLPSQSTIVQTSPQQQYEEIEFTLQRVKLEKSRSLRSKSQNDDDYQLIMKPDVNVTTNLTRKESLLNNSNVNSNIANNQDISRSTINLRAFSLNEDLKKDNNLHAHSTPTKSTSSMTTTTAKSQQNTTPTLHSKKSLIKINLEKSLTSLHTNVIKGINAGIGIASDFLYSSMILPQSTNQSESSIDTTMSHHSTSSPSSRVSSSVYIPQSSATLKRINVLDSSDFSPLQSQQQQQNQDINVPPIAISTTMTTTIATTTTTTMTNTTTTTTTTKRKVSKSKEDYKPSRFFVENLQIAKQRGRSSDSSDCSIKHGSNSTRSSSLSTNSMNENDVGTARRSKRAGMRHKSSITRAKSFSQQTQTDEQDLVSRAQVQEQVQTQQQPVQQQAPQHTNPNLIASLYGTQTTNEPAVKRSTSMKHDEIAVSSTPTVIEPSKTKALTSNRLSSVYYMSTQPENFKDTMRHLSANDSLLKMSDKRISSSTMNINESIIKDETLNQSPQKCLKAPQLRQKQQEQQRFLNNTSNLQPLSQLSSKSIAHLAFNTNNVMLPHQQRHLSTNSPIRIPQPSPQQPQHHGSMATNLDSQVNVTWSVSHIRKQFENTDDMTLHSNSTRVIKPRGDSTVNGYPTTIRIKNVPYRDMYGNPTTYI